jgi:hypothetical protein
MTRFLSESLQAPEPTFRLGLRYLEKANGHPNTDIRFSAEVIQSSRAKLHELGLDRSDTTAEELYHALQARIKADDDRLTRKLRMIAASHVSAEANVNDGLVRVLRDCAAKSQGYGLKATVLRTLIKKNPPKKALKQLGYRSFDSMLKHESAIQILAAAWITESITWRHKFVEHYKHLQPSDFESRKVIVEHPTASRWQGIAAKAVSNSRHTVLSFKELGAVVVLPLPDHVPSGSVTATLVLALHELNEVKASATFLKLCQVRNDFGGIVQTVAQGEPMLSANELDQAVPWQIIQRFYARMEHLFSAELFEPHIELRDLSWHSVEHLLTEIEPSFHFWESSSYLGLMHHGTVVSMNLVDATLNYCNQLPFERRLHQQYQKSLWHELLMRYLQPETVERTILSQLQPAFASESLLAGAA